MATRLTDLDVSGLGISTLAGQTLVQYSGSLTGRDFRAIAQTAPFVLYDMVTPECLETWKALSKLVPLIWQPEIPDLTTHLVRVSDVASHSCSNFLLRRLSRKKYSISCSAQLAGPFGGSINRNSIFSCVWLSTYDTSGLPSSLQLRHLNLSMRSYELRVCT